MDVHECYAKARALMDEWGLEDWKLRLGTTKTALGRTFSSGVIELSEPLIKVNTWEDTYENCVRHEIAHALAGVHNRHNDVWKHWAQVVGARPRSHDAAVQTSYKWVATCAGCGSEHGRHRRPRNGQRRACAHCCNKYSGGRFDTKYLLVWVDTEQTGVLSS